MSPYQRFTWLLAGFLTLLAALPARANDENLADMQLFSPLEVRPYGDGPEPRTGWFFRYDPLVWNVQRPDVAFLGVPPPAQANIGTALVPVIAQSTLTTADMTDAMTFGNRFQVGRMGEEHGFQMEGYWLNPVNLSIRTTSVTMLFNQKLAAVQPTYTSNTFDAINAENDTNNWSVQVEYIRRFRPNWHGGDFELLLGVRYLEFDEQFNIGRVSD